MRKAIFLVLVLVTVWLLASCASSDKALPTEVKGEQVERPTTTSWDPPPVPDNDNVIGGLVERVPSLRGAPTDAIRSKLLGTVCDEIDSANGDFMSVGDAIVSASVDNFEFDYSDAGAIVADAVLVECPEWQDAAREFADSGS